LKLFSTFEAPDNIFELLEVVLLSFVFFQNICFKVWNTYFTIDFIGSSKTCHLIQVRLIGNAKLGKHQDVPSFVLNMTICY